MLPLSHHTALVTGAGQGIGKGIALALAREGARVAVNDLPRSPHAAETVAEIVAAGGEAFTALADVREAGAVHDMIDRVVSRAGALTILVNNAGVHVWKPLVDVTEAEWDEVIDTNLKGCFLCTQAAARHMKAHGGGAVINIGSGSNRIAFPQLSAYTASKGGIEMLTKVAAVELGRFCIRVNCVAPGAIEVERTRRESPDYAANWGAITPLGRVGTPADVAAAVVFLASDAASFISGQTLWVDGALFAQSRWALGSGL
jgi:NAD(P)-dependent dehydrogenase (short-subunit alcohol dehydrogenase family)